jgi:hypothetical protein
MADKLLKLKLDMVYRDFPIEEAKVKFNEALPPLVVVPPPPPTTTVAVKRKLVKPLLPKSK